MSHRRATFHVYGGTGNSRRVTVWLADAARADGAAITLRPIELVHIAQIDKGEQALLVEICWGVVAREGREGMPRMERSA